MKVGLNLVFLGERAGGVGRYARELAGALVEVRPELELHAFVGRHAPSDLWREPWADAVRWTRLPVTLDGPPLHLLAQFGALPAIALARGLDVLHSPATVGPVRVPRVACVVTVLDLIPMRFGEEWEAGSGRIARQRLPLICARHADRTLAISHAAAEDFVQAAELDRQRVDVVPLGVRSGPVTTPTPEPELRARLGLGDAPVVLCVAQKRAYKRQDSLVRALHDLADLDVRLVLPGTRTPFEDELRRLAQELGVADRVVLPDWVDEADLEGLYSLAGCFALPSRAEGFGLPVLEAMRRDVPVVCSTAGALPEVAGDAALLVDSEDEAGLIAAIRRVLTEPGLADTLRARGRRRCAELTWQRTAELTIAGYERAIAQRSR